MRVLRPILVGLDVVSVFPFGWPLLFWHRRAVPARQAPRMVLIPLAVNLAGVAIFLARLSDAWVLLRAVAAACLVGSYVLVALWHHPVGLESGGVRPAERRIARWMVWITLTSAAAGVGVFFVGV